MNISDWIVWCALPAVGLTYGIIGAELLDVPRGLFLIISPKMGRRFIGCSMCVGFWCSACFTALAEYAPIHNSRIGRVLLAGLCMSGIFWLWTSLVSAIATRTYRDGRIGNGTETKVDDPAAGTAADPGTRTGSRD